MSVRFVLAPQAALDLVEIWRYIKEQTMLFISAIREKIEFLAGTPGAGQIRKKGFNRRRCKNFFLGFSVTLSSSIRPHGYAAIHGC